MRPALGLADEPGRGAASSRAGARGVAGSEATSPRVLRAAGGKGSRDAGERDEPRRASRDPPGELSGPSGDDAERAAPLPRSGLGVATVADAGFVCQVLLPKRSARYAESGLSAIAAAARMRDPGVSRDGDTASAASRFRPPLALSGVSGVRARRACEGGVRRARRVISAVAWDPGAGVAGAPAGEAKRRAPGVLPLARKMSAYCDFAERTRASCAARVAEPSHSLSANFCLRRSAFAARSGDARVVASSDIAADGGNAESESARGGRASTRFDPNETFGASDKRLEKCSRSS